MSKHTPGPWLRSGKTVYALTPRNFNRFCALVQDAHTPDDELIANAVLMQAAPDMLVALVEARDVIAVALKSSAPDWFATDEDIASHVTISRIDQAIAKARGEA